MKKTILLVGMGFLLFSCGSDESTASSTETSESTSANSEDLNCNLLEGFKDDYSKLLTKEDITSVYPVVFADAKEDKRGGSYGEYIFSWPSDRPDIIMESSGMKLNIPDKNTLGIKTFSYSTSDVDMKSFTERFDMAYKELSKEELAKIDKNIEKQEEEIKSTAKDMMEIRGNRSWEFVDDLGSSAWYKWNDKYGGELAVLAGKAKFYIVIKTSNDPNENRELAKKLAKKVIGKC